MTSQPLARPAATTSSTDDALAREVLAAFRGSIKPVRSSLTYKLGLLLVAVVMLVLPAVYLALIGLVIYGVGLHLVSNLWLMDRPGLYTLILYVAPLIMGGMVVFFMIKPLFAPAGERPGTRSLTRDGEPLLFAFVDRICEVVGAPRPARIDVFAEPNAAASFRSGWLSLLTGDLVLHIGVPLVAGMSMRQFAGILAHEFGHFSQGAGMRLSYVVSSINAWFERVVYQRDQWDQWLEESAEDADFRIQIVLWLTMLWIGLTRRILWALMIAGQFTSRLFMRQMEFDADRYEAQLNGSAAFAGTCDRLGQIIFAHHGALRDLNMLMREGRLSDNLPKLVAAKMQTFSAKDRADMQTFLRGRKTGWFDSHPSDAERIASAALEESEGVFTLEYPATALFSNFDQLAKNVTWDLYRQNFGNEFSRESLHDTDALLGTLGQHQQNEQAIERYCQGCFTLLRRMQLPTATPEPPLKAKQTLQDVKNAREKMLAETDRYATMLAEYDLADTRLLECKQVTELLYAQLGVKKTDFQVPTTSTSAVLRARADAQVVQGRLDDKLIVCETLLGERLHGALQLLYVPQVADRIKNAAPLREETMRCYDALIRLSAQLTTLTQLRNEHSALGGLLSRLGRRNTEAHVDSVQRSLREVHRLTTELREELMRVDYPFAHAKSDMNVGKYCLPTMPIASDIGAIYNNAGEFMQSFIDLYVRIVGQLCSTAEQVETVVGLPKLEAKKKAE
jgi:Zn-dependent protease with chaperone function